jgi:hypothetical protein
VHTTRLEVRDATGNDCQTVNQRRRGDLGITFGIGTRNMKASGEFFSNDARIFDGLSGSNCRDTFVSRSVSPTETGHGSDLTGRPRQHGGRHERSGWPVPLRCGAFRGDAQRRLQFDSPLHLLLLPNARRRRCDGGNGCDKVLQGEDALTSYRFHTGSAQHFFCSRCGIYTHHQRRSDQNLYAVNVACLDGVSPFDFSEVPVMDGVNHTSDTGRPTRRAGTLRFIPAD